MQNLLIRVFCFIAFFASSIAYADKPFQWQLNFQTPASPVMEQLFALHNYLLVIITIIVVLVMILLGYTCWRFSEKNNPIPSKTSHNVKLEIAWTILPFIILMTIAVPSFKALYYMERTPEDTAFTVKIVGHQWYWRYIYPDHDNLEFESYMLKDKDLKAGQLRLLEVDNRVVIPVNKNIRFLITSGDVIHSWAVPSLGIKTDSVPGRINETWVKVNKTGVYYGQCSELCGVLHGFMPIALEVVTEEEFAEWLNTAKQKFAYNYARQPMLAYNNLAN